jgi:ribonucleoside-diphosphate reductase alpha chain
MTITSASASELAEPQAQFQLRSPHSVSTMSVVKRDGRREAIDVNKIVRAVTRAATGLADVDPMRVAVKTISGLFDGASTQALDELSIQTAAALTAEEPEYSKLAATLLAAYLAKEVSNQDIQSFSQAISRGVELGLINQRLAQFVQRYARKLNDAIDPAQDLNLEYFGMRTLADRYLLRHPQARKVIETTQYFFMRVACALSGDDVNEAISLYRSFSALDYLPSSPTLFNAGTAHEQMSSCYLLDSPEDSLDSIYQRYHEVARLSKFSGGIGLPFHRVRSQGGLIRSTNGVSNGIVPWLKTLDSSVSAVNQGGRRKGAACVYLESWHADIEAFLELRDNTGDNGRRTYNLNLANWVPDLFMQRVESGADWSLFDPADVPELSDLFGKPFEQAYVQAERQGLAKKTLPARTLYARMMRTLAETGNGWMTFKDRSNTLCNQTAKPGTIVHSSNLCTEIIEITDAGETAVCNLGSVNLARHVRAGEFDFEMLAETVHRAIPALDRVIDLNYYPIESARASNLRWRPVGLGLMGLQDVFFMLRLPFDAPEAGLLSTRIQAHIYFHALSASVELAQKHGAHPAFSETHTAQGKLHTDLCALSDIDELPWAQLRDQIARNGLRNSLLIAIAPTATIASIAGCYECTEPQISNLFKRETLSGDFLQVNRYLVNELKRLGLWTDATRAALKQNEGSVQAMKALPEPLRAVYRTCWELPQKVLIDLAAARTPYIDQSQSLNLFIENPSIGAVSSMYMYAWKVGLKTTYYLRSRPATKIAKSALSADDAIQANDAAVSCSLENPGSCEACQ